MAHQLIIPAAYNVTGNLAADRFIFQKVAGDPSQLVMYQFRQAVYGQSGGSPTAMNAWFLYAVYSGTGVRACHVHFTPDATTSTPTLEDTGSTGDTTYKRWKFYRLNGTDAITYYMSSEFTAIGLNAVCVRVTGVTTGGSFQVAVDYSGTGTWVDEGSPLSTVTAATDYDYHLYQTLSGVLTANSKIRLTASGANDSRVQCITAYHTTDQPLTTGQLWILPSARTLIAGVPSSWYGASLEHAWSVKSAAGSTNRFAGGIYHNAARDTEFRNSVQTINGNAYTPNPGYLTGISTIERASDVYYSSDGSYTDEELIATANEVYQFSDLRLRYIQTWTNKNAGSALGVTAFSDPTSLTSVYIAIWSGVSSNLIGMDSNYNLYQLNTAATDQNTGTTPCPWFMCHVPGGVIAKRTLVSVSGTALRNVQHLASSDKLYFVADRDTSLAMDDQIIVTSDIEFFKDVRYLVLGGQTASQPAPYPGIYPW